MATATAASMESASLICTRPADSAISAGARPLSNISSNTVFAMLEFRRPSSTIPMRSDRCLGSMGTSSSDFPVALRRRVISLSIQLPAALARAASVPLVPRPAATTDSKKSAVSREAVNSEES